MCRATEGSLYMNTFFPHCPLRQEDHYWLDTCAGSTGLHYYAAVDTGLTKRNLSSICLSVRAESGTAMQAKVGRHSSKLAAAHNPLHPPRTVPSLPPSPSHAQHRCTAFSTSHIKETAAEWETRVQGGTNFIFNSILHSKGDVLFILFISSTFRFCAHKPKQSSARRRLIAFLFYFLKKWLS